MRITETIWLYFSFVACFLLVCDPIAKLILQISSIFKETCWKLHRKTEEADNTIKELLSKLSDCCDELGKMDLDNSTIENLCSDMAALMAAVNYKQYEVEISAYQADILATSHDMYMLLQYSGSSDIKVDPLLLKLYHIFDCIKEQCFTHLWKGLQRIWMA